LERTWLFLLELYFLRSRVHFVKNAVKPQAQFVPRQSLRFRPAGSFAAHRHFAFDKPDAAQL